MDDSIRGKNLVCAIPQAHMIRKLCEAAKAGDGKGVRHALRNGAPINGHGPMVRGDSNI